MTGKVKDKMEVGVTVSPDDLLSDALSIMFKRHLQTLPVVYENEPIGMLNKSEILDSENKNARKPEEVVVAEILKLPVHTIHMEQYLEKAAEIMLKNKIDQLVVLAQNDQMTGIMY